MARAIARVLEKSQVEVVVYARSPELRDSLRAALPAAKITHEISESVAGAPVVFLAVSADKLKEAAQSYGDHATGDQIVLTACRGVGPGFVLPHQIIRSVTCVRKIGVLGGPIHARELQGGRQINAVLASRYSEVSGALKKLTQGSLISLSLSKDLIGVQVAGAIANVASIAAGMADFVALGDTARGILLTHGLVEARRLGVALGAEDATFSGLAGVGELIPRHVTSMDRHLELGAKLAAGAPLAQAMGELDGHVEGVATAFEAVAAGQRLGLKLPLMEAVHAVLVGKARAQEVLEQVLARGLELEARA